VATPRDVTAATWRPGFAGRGTDREPRLKTARAAPPLSAGARDPSPAPAARPVAAPALPARSAIPVVVASANRKPCASSRRIRALGSAEISRALLRLADEGFSGTEIARCLKLSEGTVRNYLSESIGKLGARNRVEAARIARQRGWL
jgi:DNA-binding CsgD family transcriptional regulator